MARTIPGGCFRDASGNYKNGKGEPIDMKKIPGGDRIMEVGAIEYVKEQEKAKALPIEKPVEQPTPKPKK